MNKYTKNSVKTNKPKLVLSQFVYTKKDKRETFRATKDFQDLVNTECEKLGLSKTDFYTNLVLHHVGLVDSVENSQELVYGKDWEF